LAKKVVYLDKDRDIRHTGKDELGDEQVRWGHARESSAECDDVTVS